MKGKALLLLVIVVSSGCLPKEPQVLTVENIENVTSTKTSSGFEFFFSTNKKIYHSNELMNISLKVKSPQEVEKVKIEVYGIHSQWKRVRKNKVVNLKAGKNEFLFHHRTPSCYGCAGISPGTYNLTAEVKYGGKIVKRTLQVEIRE